MFNVCTCIHVYVCTDATIQYVWDTNGSNVQCVESGVTADHDSIDKSTDTSVNMYQ